MFARNLAASLLAGLTPLLASAASYSVPIANYSGFSDYPAYVNEHLAQRVKSELQRRGLGLLVTSDAFEMSDETICFARAGVTYVDSGGRTPRAPGKQLWLTGYADKGAMSAKDCQIRELKSVITDMNSHGLQDYLHDQDSLRPSGGTYKADRPSLKVGGQLQTRDDLKALIRAVADTPAVDVLGDQNLQVFVSGFVTNIRGGAEIVCLATVGITSASPEGREPRWPASSLSYLITRSRGDEAGCGQEAAIQAMRALFANPWNAHGVFKDIDLAREDGIAPPNLELIDQRWNAWNKAHGVARSDK